MKAEFIFRIKLALIFSILLIAENSIFSQISDEEIEPGIDDFVACESEPQVDLKKLNECTFYPIEARRNGIQGNVIIRVLIGKEGELRRSVIEESDNELLSKAAIAAVNYYGKFVPAMQMGKPVMCWVSIPISFKLKDEVIEQKTIDFVKVDSEPWIDVLKLAKCVVYPDIARRNGIQGRVLIKAQIGIDGEVIKLVVEHSDNIDLNEAALNAVNECAEFKPAFHKGIPTESWISIPINFKLKDELAESNNNNFIEIEQDPWVDLNQLMQCVEYPDISRRAGIQGRVIVRALIDIDGKVIKAVIEDTDNVTLNDAALKAVKDCADFKPAIVKGKPIICWVSIPITFRLKDPE